MQPLPSVALKHSEPFVLWNAGSCCSHFYEGLPQLEEAMEDKRIISGPAVPSLCICNPVSSSQRLKVMFVLSSQWNSSQSSDISTLEPLDSLSCLQICAATARMWYNDWALRPVSQGTPPWTPLWAVPDILDAIPSTTGRVERGIGDACPLQHGLPVVAPGTVARWHSLKPSHPSPKALLAPHQPRSDHSKAPALQELPGWEPGACFTWLQSPSVQKHLEAFCPLQPSHHLLVSLIPNTDVELWLLVCVLSHPLAWCIVFPSIHQPWVDPSICRVRIHKSLRAGSVLLHLKGK